MTPDDVDPDICRVDASPESALSLPALHEIFLAPPASPDPPSLLNNPLPTPSIQLCMAQNEHAPHPEIVLGLSLTELEDLLRQFAPVIDPLVPTTPVTPQLPAQFFSNLFVDEPLPAVNVPMPTHTPPPAPTPGTTSPHQ